MSPASLQLRLDLDSVTHDVVRFGSGSTSSRTVASRLRSFFRRSAATRQTYPVNWPVRQRIGQLHPTPTNGLLIEACDLH